MRISEKEAKSGILPNGTWVKRTEDEGGMLDPFT